MTKKWGLTVSIPSILVEIIWNEVGLKKHCGKSKLACFVAWNEEKVEPKLGRGHGHSRSRLDAIV